MKKNQNGFSAIEGLLILVIVAIIGFTGWYVWQVNGKADKALTANNSSTPSFKKKAKPAEVPSTIVDPAAKWQTVKSAKGAFSIKIPDGWKINNAPDSDDLRSDRNSADLVYVAGKPATITNETVPGNDAPTRFFLFTATDERPGWTDANATKATFNTNSGIAGVRYYQLYSSASEGGIGPVAGEKTYEYFFKSSSKIYHAVYRILPGDSDNLTAVEQSLKTLTVN